MFPTFAACVGAGLISGKRIWCTGTLAGGNRTVAPLGGFGGGGTDPVSSSNVIIIGSSSSSLGHLWLDHLWLDHHYWVIIDWVNNDQSIIDPMIDRLKERPPHRHHHWVIIDRHHRSTVTRWAATTLWALGVSSAAQRLSFSQDGFQKFSSALGFLIWIDWRLLIIINHY